MRISSAYERTSSNHSHHGRVGGDRPGTGAGLCAPRPRVGIGCPKRRKVECAGGRNCLDRSAPASRDCSRSSQARRRRSHPGAVGGTRRRTQFVVNNAGFGLVGLASARDRDEQLQMIDLNVRVLTELSLAFIDTLARHRGGLLNVGSMAGFLPGPGMAVYYATKAYVLSFTEA